MIYVTKVVILYHSIDWREYSSRREKGFTMIRILSDMLTKQKEAVDDDEGEDDVESESNRDDELEDQPDCEKRGVKRREYGIRAWPPLEAPFSGMAVGVCECLVWNC